MTSQLRKTSQVSRCSETIISNETAMPMIGTNGTQGTRNGRCKSGCCLRRIQTPPETTVKANSVPMLVSSSSLLIGNVAASNATQIPTKIVEIYGVRILG